MSVTVEQIAEFSAGMRGNVIGRDDEAYDGVRALYNAMIDKRPSLIAQCRDAADVISAVNFGRDNQLRIAIRGGGKRPEIGGLSFVERWVFCLTISRTNMLPGLFAGP